MSKIKVLDTHLKQNYIMGFVFNETDLCLTDEWYEDIKEVLDTVSIDDAVNELDMQIDKRLEKIKIN